MAAPLHLNRWAWAHKWSSLTCTAFLLLIFLTGLPLIFHDEIEDWLEPPHYVDLPASTPRASFDRLISDAQRAYPGHIVTSVFADDDEPQVYVWLAPSWGQYLDEPRSRRFMRFDARTGAVLDQSRSLGDRRITFIGVMLRLHMDMFAGLPGALFMGFMGLLFVIAMVSGVVLYGPFMKKLEFGTVRAERGRRLKWLDLHNLLGIVTLTWALVVGATGAMNELARPLFALWRQIDVQTVLAPWRGQPIPPSAEWVAVDAVYAAAHKAVPGMVLTGATFPGSPFGSPHHFLLWAKGDAPLTSRLFSPVLVDARTGTALVVNMPWYLRALELSRPLHFGDYGGLPLKILWAILDLVTIVVLGSGLYLWFARRKQRVGRLARFERVHASGAPS